MDEMKMEPKKIKHLMICGGSWKMQNVKKKKGLNLGITMNETKIDKNNI